MATGDGTLDSSEALTGHRDGPEPTDHDVETERYFTLIVECAKRVQATYDSGMTLPDFWSDRIYKAWVESNACLRSPRPVLTHMTDGQKMDMYVRSLGVLARECLMAAWSLGMRESEVLDDPEQVEWILADHVSEMLR